MFNAKLFMYGAPVGLIAIVAVFFLLSSVSVAPDNGHEEGLHEENEGETVLTQEEMEEGEIGDTEVSTETTGDLGMTVLITDSGFVPTHITVTKGTAVTWVNNSTSLRWPASNPHPTHTGYPSDERGCINSAFDACRGMKSGESYSFIFDKVGSWGVHDHLRPAFTMTVDVVETQ